MLSVALITMSFAACSSTSATPTSPSTISGSTSLTADALAATWRLQSIQKVGQPEQIAPAGADYTVTFTDRLSLRADCNTCSSAYTISGSTLSVASAMACTRAACPTMAFESEYTSLLTGDHTVSATGTSMTWVSSRGTVRFSR
jgi:heat shock protein HslJ